ncbi:MAG: hypothetical protein CSA95_00855 [Bacteroidetes bacterium]|nr:MAG: hypothetical protein CSA95_00855 [Bacteroidota bacterium]PIE88146.1 MAG: hypothetical protein CSA04_03365 [Bacteroidota bacterium]
MPFTNYKTLNIPVSKSPHFFILSAIVGLFFITCGRNHNSHVKKRSSNNSTETTQTITYDSDSLYLLSHNEKSNNNLPVTPNSKEDKESEGSTPSKEKKNTLWSNDYKHGRLNASEKKLIHQAEKLIRVSPYDSELETIYHNLGLIYYHKKDYYSSIYYLLLALKLILYHTSIENQPLRIARILQQITLSLYQLEDYKRAQQVFYLLQQTSLNTASQKVDLYDPCLENVHGTPTPSKHSNTLLQTYFRQCVVSIKFNDCNAALNALKMLSGLIARETSREPLWQIRYHHVSAAYYQLKGQTLQAIAHYRKANIININILNNRPLYATHYVETLFNIAKLQVDLFHKNADPLMLKEALSTYREAITQTAIPLSEIKEDKSRIIYNEHLYHHYKAYISLLLSLYHNTSFTDKTNALILNEIITISELCKYRTVQNRKVPKPPHSLKATQRYIHQFLQKAGKNPSNIREAIKEVPFLNHAYIRSKEEGSTLKKGDFSITSIQEQLNDKEIIINYLLSSDSIYCNLISNNALSIITIGEITAVKEALQHCLVAIKKLHPNEKLTPSITRLSTLLIDPIAPYIASFRTIYVVNEGITSHIPFDCLKVKGKYLIEQYTIHELLYLSGWEKKFLPLTPSLSFLAFAPSATHSVPEIAPSLAFSKIEIEQCAYFLTKKGWHCHTYLNEDASMINFQKALTSDGMLHLSGHLYALEREESYPYLLLNEGGHPIKYYQWHITPQDIKVKHLVLSTCGSGCGPYYDSEGVDSFVRSFHYAGVEHIIYTRWELEDQFASFFFPLYYQDLLKIGVPSKALQKTKIRCIQSEKYAHPFYWAAINGI